MIAQILQIYYLQLINKQSPPSSIDLIYDLWLPTLLGQLVLTTSIIASCFPSLKYLIDALETGMVRADGVNTTHTQLRLDASKGGGSSNGYFRAQGSQFRRGPENTAAGLDGSNSMSARSSRWGGRSKSQGEKNVFRMQSLEGRGGAAAKGGADGSRQYQQRDGQFESTAFRGDDDESQGSQTRIVRKVEWSLTEERASERTL